MDDCQCLIDKVVARIRTWGTRTLSLCWEGTISKFSFDYWASIFVLPKKVLDGVTAICRNYLWDGRAVYARAPPIAWEIVCRRKDQGGMGIHDCHRQNLAALGKYIWNIASKTESLWLKWVNHNNLKGRNWKRYKCPSNVGWYWRSIWRVRDIMKDGYQRDIWKLNPRGYTVANGYKWPSPDYPKVNWSNWIWNRLNIPKHRYICWLAIWKRLNFRQKLKNIGVIDDSSCPLCGDQEETPEHVFFKCAYSSHCRILLLQSINVQGQFDTMESCNEWLQKIPSRFKRRVLQSYMAGFVYYIWQERNRAIWQKAIFRPDVVCIS